MKPEKESNLNFAENRELRGDHSLENTSVLSVLKERSSDKNEADINACQEDDSRKIAELRGKISAKKGVAQEKRQLTGFEKWINRIKQKKEVGSGAQKNIYIHPDDPQKIVGVFHKEQPIHKIKERFYVNKILSFLFPDNIPDIHLAASRPSAIVIDHVMGREISPWNLRHQLSRILIQRRLKRIGIFIDSNYWNFMVGSDGRIFYVDGFIGSFRWNQKKLLEKIDKLSPEERRRALNYLNRIKDLRRDQGVLQGVGIQ